MSDEFYALALGLPIWWTAQTLLSLRDYFRRKDEISRMPPPDEEEKKAITRAIEQVPPKEKRPLSWYAEHPTQVVAQGLIWLPAIVLFWPMALLLFTLPKLETRLAKEMVSRLNSESA